MPVRPGAALVAAALLAGSAITSSAALAAVSAPVAAPLCPTTDASAQLTTAQLAALGAAMRSGTAARITAKAGVAYRESAPGSTFLVRFDTATSRSRFVSTVRGSSVETIFDRSAIFDKVPVTDQERAALALLKRKSGWVTTAPPVGQRVPLISSAEIADVLADYLLDGTQQVTCSSDTSGVVLLRGQQKLLGGEATVPVSARLDPDGALAASRFGADTDSLAPVGTYAYAAAPSTLPTAKDRIAASVWDKALRSSKLRTQLVSGANKVRDRATATAKKAKRTVTATDIRNAAKALRKQLPATPKSVTGGVSVSVTDPLNTKRKLTVTVVVKTKKAVVTRNF